MWDANNTREQAERVRRRVVARVTGGDEGGGRERVGGMAGIRSARRRRCGVGVCESVLCFCHSGPLSGKHLHSTVGAGQASRCSRTPGGKADHSTQREVLPAVIGGHDGQLLTHAVNIYCRAGRLLRAGGRACVRAAVHGTCYRQETAIRHAPC